MDEFWVFVVVINRMEAIGMYDIVVVDIWRSA